MDKGIVGLSARCILQVSECAARFTIDGRVIASARSQAPSPKQASRQQGGPDKLNLRPSVSFATSGIRTNA